MHKPIFFAELRTNIYLFSLDGYKSVRGKRKHLYQNAFFMDLLNFNEA